jgi:hypothetical protein
MRIALTTALTAIILTGCSSDDAPTCNDTCKTTSQKLNLTEANTTIHDQGAKTFTAEGVDYTLVRVEYGDTQECDIFDNCSYSTYCGFVVDNQDYPIEVNWVSDADALFDVSQFCPDGDLDTCDLPGASLPIMDDPDFEDWVYDTDPDEDKLVDCFADYY